jgi:hypothetical protein
MLGGIDPVIIFQFSKLADTGFGDFISKIPVISQIPTVIAQPPIPIYLSETLTGIYIDSEDKNVDIETETESLSDGSTPEVNQKAIGSVVSINLVAKKNSLGLTLLSAMIDLLYEKVTSKEYAITYLHGATTVFRGVLHSYSVNQNASNELLTIKIELSRGQKQPQKAAGIPSVPGVIGTLPGG